MLTNCGCIANKEQTEIIEPCLLHAQWAEAYAARRWGYGQPSTGVQPGASAKAKQAR